MSVVDQSHETRSTSAQPSPLVAWMRQYRDRKIRDGLIDARDNRMMDEIAARLLTSKSNCIEVGAHGGRQLQKIVAIAPRGRHIAFEPLPDMARELATRFPTVKVHEIALSDREGLVNFNHCLSTPGWSGFKRWHPSQNQQAETIIVKTMPMDDVIPQNLRIRLMKIDVEGAEMQVLRGAVETIRRSRPYIIFEHGWNAADAHETTPEMIFDFFNAQQYDICGLANWLRGRKPFSRQRFSQMFRLHKAWNFIAQPRKISLWRNPNNVIFSRILSRMSAKR